MSKAAGYIPYEPQLHPVQWGDGIWTVDGPEVAYTLSGMTIPCPTRMTIVRLADGKVWLHSPIAFSPDLLASIEAIGPVAVVVAPNTLHHLFFAAWAKACPDAALFAAPGLGPRFGDAIANRPVAVLEDQLAASWRADIDLHVIELGTFCEAVFHHRASGTLIVTDLMQNFEARRVRNLLVRLILMAGGATGPNGRPSIEIRFAARRHRAALRRGVEQMLAWQPRSVILSHGLCYREDAMKEIKRAFAWID